MEKLPTISIGIPAYNEESTIQSLLVQVFSQKTTGFTIKEVIVVSDGSIDRTIDQVKKIKNKKIRIINGKKRLGKSARLNQIFRTFRGDILFLIDADTVIKNRTLFTELLKQTDFRKNGIVSVKPVPLAGKNFFEKVINFSVQIVNEIRAKWNNGHNHLAFRGSFMGMWGEF